MWTRLQNRRGNEACRKRGEPVSSALRSKLFKRTIKRIGLLRLSIKEGKPVRAICGGKKKKSDEVTIVIVWEKWAEAIT